MPVPVKLREMHVQASFAVRLEWTFEANLSALPGGGYKSAAIKGVPLLGTWQFEVRQSADNDDEIDLFCSHGDLAYGALGMEVDVTMRLDWIHDGRPLLLRRSHFGEEPVPDRSGPAKSPYACWKTNISKKSIIESHLKERFASSQAYRVSVILSRHAQPEQAEREASPPSYKDLAVNVVHCAKQWQPHDFRLVFPSGEKPGPELWSNSTFLSQVSPYYRAMFASGAIETIPRRSKRKRLDPQVAAPAMDSAQIPDGPDWIDSDDETDELTREKEAESAENSSSMIEDLDMEYREVQTRQTAYSTYCAVLLFMQTGYIAFAPLRSLCAPRNTFMSTTRKKALVRNKEKSPTLPFPVSPKSVFRLAHLLQLPALQELALENLTSALSISGAASELFSPVSVAYEEVRKVVRAYILKHLDEVCATDAWKEYKDKAARGEVEGGAMVMTELFDAMVAAKHAETKKENAES